MDADVKINLDIDKGIALDIDEKTSYSILRRGPPLRAPGMGDLKKQLLGQVIVVDRSPKQRALLLTWTASSPELRKMGLLSVDIGLLWGMAACSCGLLGFPGNTLNPWYDRVPRASRLGAEARRTPSQDQLGNLRGQKPWLLESPLSEA